MNFYSIPSPPHLSSNVKIFLAWLNATGVGGNYRNVLLNWHSCSNQLQEDTILTSDFIYFIKTENLPKYLQMGNCFGILCYVKMLCFSFTEFLIQKQCVSRGLGLVGSFRLIPLRESSILEFEIKSESIKTAHITKLAITKSSTIFAQSLWNLVKINTSWGNDFDQV